MKEKIPYPEELVGLSAGSGLKNTFFRASNTYMNQMSGCLNVTFHHILYYSYSSYLPELHQQTPCRSRGTCWGSQWTGTWGRSASVAASLAWRSESVGPCSCSASDWSGCPRHLWTARDRSWQTGERPWRWCWGWCCCTSGQNGHCPCTESKQKFVKFNMLLLWDFRVSWSCKVLRKSNKNIFQNKLKRFRI